MKNIVNFIKQGWFLSLLGVIALSAIIYFVAPLFFRGYQNLELIVYSSIAFLIGLWVLIYLWKYLSSRRKNKKLLADMVADEPVDVDPVQNQIDDELSHLQGRLSDALVELQGSKFKSQNGDSKYLYELPWYVIIGPPGSGKTTLLKNSNLGNSLSGKLGSETVSGVGGTRNCDWWFAEEAVLLDTAGRYTTQDSHTEVDRKSWLGFLKILKESRPRRPINGIIIAISLDELLVSQRLLVHTKKIKARIQELYDSFNLSLPIYLVITKTDLLSGFSEFFYDLEELERNQVWGVTFTEENKAINTPLSLLEKDLDQLEDRLNKKVVYKLEKEIDLERRKKIYAFPQQFGSIKKSINSFANEICSQSRYSNDVFLRGVYFTSAEQTGTPIDKLLTTLSHLFGFTQKSSKPFQAFGKSFFINNLLKKVIIGESELAGTDERYERLKRIYQRTALFIASLSLIVASTLWYTSFTKNNEYTRIVAKNVATLKESLEASSKKYDLVTAVALLNRAKNLSTPKPEILATLGLDQQERLIREADNTYRDLLNSRLLPQVIKVLEEELHNNKSSPIVLFRSLKAYLILAPYEDEHFKSEKGLIKEIIKSVWKRDYLNILSPEQFNNLSVHLDSLLETKPTRLQQPLDNALIDSTRRILEETKLSKLVYDQVKAELLLKSQQPSLVIAGSRGFLPNAKKVFERKSGTPLEENIPSFYTYYGYQEFRGTSGKLVASFIEDNWVLDNKSEKINLVDTQLEILGLYQEEYIEIWDNILLDLKIKKPSNLKHAAEIISLLGDPDQSPFSVLLDEVISQTYFSQPLEDAQSAKNGLGQKVGTAAAKQFGYAATTSMGRIGQILESSVSTEDLEALAKKKTGKSFDIVSTHFNKIRRLRANGNSTYEDIIRRLDSLSTSLRTLTSVIPDEMKNEQQRSVAKELEELKIIALRQPAPLNGWLLEISAEIVSLLSGDIKDVLNMQWKTNIASFCQQKLQARYPLSSNSSKEIAIDDFSVFFGPNGRLETFFKQNLAPSIDRLSDKWKWRGTDPSPISSNTLEQFQRAEKIRKGFFPNNSQTPNINFTIKPIKMSDSISNITIDIDGTTLEYDNGQARPVAVKWPGPKRSGYVVLEYVVANTGASSSISREGPWSLYQMFTQKGRLIKVDDHNFRLIFNESGNIIEFMLNATSSDNSFNLLKELSRYRCPMDLAK